MVVGIVHPFGGAGRSRITAVLAKYFAEHGKKVLVLDGTGSPRSSAACFFARNLPDSSSPRSLFDWSGGELKAWELSHHEVVSFDEGCPAVRLVVDRGDEWSLLQGMNEAIAIARTEFDIIVCDTPRANKALLSGLSFDQIVVPLTGDGRCIDACEYMLDASRDARVAWELLGVVHTSSFPEYDERYQIPRRLQEAAGDYFLGSIPNHMGWGELFPALARAGGPVSEETVKAYRAFALEVLGRLEDERFFSPAEQASPLWESLVEVLRVTRSRKAV